VENTVTILILIALSTQVLPVAIGINPKKGFISIWHGFILIISQLIFLYAGYTLGGRFLYLLESYKGIVLFAGFFLIGMRMIVDVFKIRKGDRTYYLDNTATLILASVAQGINSLLAGMILTYLPFDISKMIIVLSIGTVIFLLLGMLLKAEKRSFAISALLFFISGLIMVFSSLYLGFFNT
jgi:putative Mn2+ efflux pump MntP